MLSIYVSASEVNVDFIKNGLDAAAALNSELEILEYTYVFVSVGDQGHTWNRVKIDGIWYNIDTTWDDPLPNQGKVSYKYFNVSDKVLKKDHDWKGSGESLPAGIDIY